MDEHRARVARAARALLQHAGGELQPASGDPGADLRIPWGSAEARLRVVEGDPPLLTVWAVVLDGVPCSAGLLEELNRMNAGIVTCRVFWADDAVVAATEVPVAELQPAELEHALWAVGSFADWADTTLQPRFGGRVGA